MKIICEKYGSLKFIRITPKIQKKIQNTYNNT